MSFSLRLAPNPKDVFESPAKFWDFLTAKSDEDFEGQHFDRKEAGLPAEFSGPDSKTALRSVRAQIQECISAFANINAEGGLLVLGISGAGEIKGVDHLNENQINAVVNIGDLLRNQAAKTKIFDCKDASGKESRICLIYAPFIRNGICETPEKNPKAWRREGKQNLPVDQNFRDQLCREKNITSFERILCCPFDPALLDRGVLAEFKRSYGEATRTSDEDLLFNVGALDRHDGNLWFTNAGLLFFASNPQRVLPYAGIRLLRFAVKSEKRYQQRALLHLSVHSGGHLASRFVRCALFSKNLGSLKAIRDVTLQGDLRLSLSFLKSR